MSRNGEIILEWGGEDRAFRLKLKQLDQLQERCGDRGPMRILKDMVSGEWRARDIAEVIRLGLVGGGMVPEQADKLIREYVEDRPLVENILHCQAILSAAVVGPPLKDETEAPAAPGEPVTAQTGSTSLSSTETEPSSAGAPPRSVN